VIDFNAEDVSETNTGQWSWRSTSRSSSIQPRSRRRWRPWGRRSGGSPCRPGFDAIRVPGDRSLGGRPARLRDGITLSPGLVRQLDELAAAQHLPPLQA